MFFCLGEGEVKLFLAFKDSLPWDGGQKSCSQKEESALLTLERGNRRGVIPLYKREEEHYREHGIATPLNNNKAIAWLVS